MGRVVQAGLVLLLAVATVPAGAMAQRMGCDSARLADLPLTERPAVHDTGQVVVVLLTGDGGWVNADEQVARGLVARGGAVIGLNMRSYLRARRTPDEVAHDVGCLADAYMTRWRRSHFMLLGYSRGADIAPFVATRLPAALRDRLTMLAMVSPTANANFQFHLIDLVRNVRRDDDLPVMPELERLAGLRMLCIYGRDDDDALCPALDGGRTSVPITVLARDGGHRITGGFDVMAEPLAEGLRATAAANR